MKISHHRESSNGNNLDRVSEYTLMHKCQKYHKFNLQLLQNMMMFQMRTLQQLIPHHHQLDHHYQLNREVAPEDTKDLGVVSEYLHTQHRQAQMKIEQLWISKIA